MKIGTNGAYLFQNAKIVVKCLVKACISCTNCDRKMKFNSKGKFEMKF